MPEPSPPVLHEHLVAGVDQLARARGRQRDAVLVRLDLGGDADSHRTNSRPRSASQNSIRSRALPMLRPVSSSTRLIR